VDERSFPNIGQRARRRASSVAALPLRWWTRRGRRVGGIITTMLLWLAHLDRSGTWRLKTFVTSDVGATLRSGVLWETDQAADAPPRTFRDAGEVRFDVAPATRFPAVGWFETSEARVLGSVHTGWMDAIGVHLEQSELQWVHSLNDTPYRLKFPGLITHDRKEALFHITDEQSVRLDRAVYVGGAFSENWYHWLLEILPRIWLSNSLPDDLSEIPLLVPERALKISTQLETLERLVPHRDLRSLGVWTSTEVGRMVWVDGLFDMVHVPSPTTGSVPSKFHLRGMRAFRSALMSGPHASDREHSPAPPRRVFLDREGFARTYNRDQVLEVAVRHGFTPVNTGLLTLDEQIALFSNAEAVVGPSGAAWANLLFARAQLIALYWLPEHLAGSRLWSSLAAVSGCTVYEITYVTSVEESKGDYFISPERLNQILKRFLTLR
jgi:hypothetical protein